MTAKEYLRQAFYLDVKINSKIEQINRLKDLVLNLGGNVSGMPKSHQPKGFEVTMNKIIDLQKEINKEIDKLVDLKREIAEAISAVESEEQRIVLELRYLGYKKIDEIAFEMGYEKRNVDYLHAEALKKVKIP